MKTRLILVCVAAAGCVVSLLAATASRAVVFPPQTVEGKSLHPLVAWCGRDSGVIARRYERITTQKDWEKLWKEHKPAWVEKRHYSSGTPEIDFNQCMVVAVFQGRSVNSDGVALCSILDEGDQLRVRVDDWSYQTLNTSDSVVPYGLFVLPRSDKPLVLEENTQGLIGAPPVWTQRAKFDKLSPPPLQPFPGEIPTR